MHKPHLDTLAEGPWHVSPWSPDGHPAMPPPLRPPHPHPHPLAQPLPDSQAGPPAGQLYPDADLGERVRDKGRTGLAVARGRKGGGVVDPKLSAYQAGRPRRPLRLPGAALPQPSDAPPPDAGPHALSPCHFPPPVFPWEEGAEGGSVAERVEVEVEYELAVAPPPPVRTSGRRPAGHRYDSRIGASSQVQLQQQRQLGQLPDEEARATLFQVCRAPSGKALCQSAAVLFIPEIPYI